ncbi:MAG TPA: intradiol ring-cleavage dioxygenase [Zeimonas sp.]
MPIPTPSLERRRIVAALPAVSVAIAMPGALASTVSPVVRIAQAQSGAGADSAMRLVASPPQTEGPFYPRDWEGDIDNDLVKVDGEDARALGDVLLLQGRVLDVAGQPIAGAAIEIWQCDAHGVYRHPRDERGERRRDPAFQGRGRTISDAAGRYRFRTIRPVPYGGRTPHIHFRVEPRDRDELVTQMYVFGEPRNARDGVLNSIRDSRQRESVIVRLERADRLEKNAITGTFDIVFA